MIKQDGFDTLIASDTDYENLMCEIYFDGRLFALVSQERSDGVFNIETPGPGLVEERIVRTVNLDGFHQAVETACRRLRGEEP